MTNFYWQTQEKQGKPKKCSWKLVLPLPNPHRVVAFFLSLLGAIPGPRHSAVSLEGREAFLIFNSQSGSHPFPSYWFPLLVSLLLPSFHPPEQWRRGDCPAPQWRHILQPDGTKAWVGIHYQCGGFERASPEPPYLQPFSLWQPKVHSGRTADSIKRDKGMLGLLPQLKLILVPGDGAYSIRCLGEHLPYSCKPRNPGEYSEKFFVQISSVSVFWSYSLRDFICQPLISWALEPARANTLLLIVRHAESPKMLPKPRSIWQWWTIIPSSKKWHED